MKRRNSYKTKEKECQEEETNEKKRKQNEEAKGE